MTNPNQTHHNHFCVLCREISLRSLSGQILPDCLKKFLSKESFQNPSQEESIVKIIDFLMPWHN